MKSNERDILGKFYFKLKGKLKDGESAFLKIIASSRKTDVLQKIKDYSLHSEDIDKDVKESLIEKNYIQSLDSSFGYYTITFKGLWEYEKSRNIIDFNNLLEALNTTFFVPETKSISTKDKVLLLTFIGCRFFSPTCKLELSDDLSDSRNFNFSEFIEQVANLLFENKLVKREKPTFLEKGNIAQYCLARADGLKKITKSIYRDDKNKKTYYLDICDENGIIEINKLTFLYKILFEGNFENSDAIINIREFLTQFVRKRYLLTANKNFLSSDSTKILVKTFDDLYFS